LALLRSLGLGAYLAAARRSPAQPYDPAHDRPDGTLIWVHATSATRADALNQLAKRLRAQRPEVTVLLTTDRETPRPTHIGPSVIWEALPEDFIENARLFLDHWAPDLGIWTGGRLAPAFLSQAAERRLPLFLIDAESGLLSQRSNTWLPDYTPAVLEAFTAILARDETAAHFLRKQGVPAEDIAVVGPLQEGTNPLPCNEAERQEMATLLAGRPVWLAAMLHPAELPVVLQAHRTASRFAHRLLLIVVPDDETEGPQFTEEIRRDEWRVAVWSEGEMPDENTQVLLADTRGEMGLWYRLAPICFMGSSLVAKETGRDPNEPAAHGSAILYGPNVARFLASYERLASAGGARIIRNSQMLSAAVQSLLAADASAAMAHAAWDVATQGAGVADRVLDLIQDTLDTLEAA